MLLINILRFDSGKGPKHFAILVKIGECSLFHIFIYIVNIPLAQRHAMAIWCKINKKPPLALIYVAAFFLMNAKKRYFCNIYF